MTDRGIITGNREDLLLDASRCLRMRFSDSSCQRCLEICPHGAVTLDGGLAIDAERCRGCLLCTAVCPVGALEQNSDFSGCLAQLSRVAEPVLGCSRTKEHSNATLACLGGLSEEHLLSLSHTLSGKLTVNLSMCSDCPNNPMIAELKKRLAALTEAGLLSGGCDLLIAESAEGIHYIDESVNRRSFLKSFRTSLFTSAAVILAPNNEQAERRIEYSRKREPQRRALLNTARSRVSQETRSQLQTIFDYSVSFKENCTQCQGCVAICPTGALKTDQPDGIPIFDQMLCTGCGLCSEFCMDEALWLSRAGNDQGNDGLDPGCCRPL